MKLKVITFGDTHIRAKYLLWVHWLSSRTWQSFEFANEPHFFASIIPHHALVGYHQVLENKRKEELQDLIEELSKQITEIEQARITQVAEKEKTIQALSAQVIEIEQIRVVQ